MHKDNFKGFLGKFDKLIVQEQYCLLLSDPQASSSWPCSFLLDKYSFNFNCGESCSNSEGIKCGWAHINPVATSTHEMGPGACQDTLDDHFGDWNWKKTTLMAISLLQKIKDMVTEANKCQHLHEHFENGMMTPPLQPSGEDGAVEPQELALKMINCWKMLLVAWEDDYSLPNLFEKQHKGAVMYYVAYDLLIFFAEISQDAVQFQLAEEEAKRL
ncbi:hypothetical protein H0H87_008845 [Tephrocybe sp. NHM501043]|nr:hypothetical protein H0H87_008845 [Tephrocybe sp. NHM501043]